VHSNAERKAYGILPKGVNLYEDVSSKALYCWEVTNVNLFKNSKDIQNLRGSRQTLSKKITCLNKLIHSIEKATKAEDIAEIVLREEAYNKILRAENQMKILKEAQERERIEKQRLIDEKREAKRAAEMEKEQKRIEE